MPERALRLSATRLVRLYVLVVLAAVGALLASVYWLTTRALEQEVSAVVRAEIDGLTDDFEVGGIDQLSAALQARGDQWGRTGAVYLLADAGLNRLGGNLTGWPTGATPHAGRQEFRVQATEASGQVEHPIEAQLVSLASQYWLLVGTDVSEQRRFSQRFLWATVWGTGLTALLMAILGAWYSRRVRSRVRLYAETCRTIIAGDLTQRLPLDGSHDEFDALGEAVNRVLDRLERQTTSLQTTFDCVAHDLRTPLYRVRVRLDEALLRADTPAATRAMMISVTADLEQVQRTLATLLQIAQAESRGAIAAAEPIDLAVLAAELTELYQPKAQSVGLTLSGQFGATAGMLGSRQLLAQLITNLLENAMKYVPSGGTVLIGTFTDQHSDRVVLTVADNGPGIAPADRERALQPFQRIGASPDRDGSGLGLALVDAVVHLHAGELELTDNAPGLEVICRFPAVASTGAALEQHSSDRGT
ncbi:MAG TPA: HAMP domain-containing sensor histidine kinase, partial [Steroidobacteraceae bacterium]|nr:HAMP domain-containing sensor histidine kinase [Steroidobacteraceae bacterium]